MQRYAYDNEIILFCNYNFAWIYDKNNKDKLWYRTKEKTGLHQYFVSILDILKPSLADDAARTRNQLLGRQWL